MSDNPNPKNWREAAPYVVWGILAFSFGMEGCVTLVHFEWLSSFFSFAGMLAVISLYFAKDRIIERLSTLHGAWFLVVPLVCLVALTAIPILSEKLRPRASGATADEIAAAVVKALPQSGGFFNEATPKPQGPPRSKQAINELLEESGAILTVFESSGGPLINEWRESITTQNPERICLDLDSQSLQFKITGLANKLDNAHNGLAAIYDKNRIDQPEFNKVLGASSPVGAGGFAQASQVLRQYAHELNLRGEHPSCETLIRTGNIPNTYENMIRGLNEFGVWVAQSQEHLSRYRDDLRKELRNAP